MEAQHGSNQLPENSAWNRRCENPDDQKRNNWTCPRFLSQCETGRVANDVRLDVDCVTAGFLGTDRGARRDIPHQRYGDHVDHVGLKRSYNLNAPGLAVGPANEALGNQLVERSMDRCLGSLELLRQFTNRWWVAFFGDKVLELYEHLPLNGR
ncbi:hypothetical protein N8639_01155 [bacterium]|nr:hypothetical protein [bacterium]